MVASSALLAVRFSCRVEDNPASVASEGCDEMLERLRAGGVGVVGYSELGIARGVRDGPAWDDADACIEDEEEEGAAVTAVPEA